LHTDESGAYAGIHFSGFDHEIVNHGAGEYARGDVRRMALKAFLLS